MRMRNSHRTEAGTTLIAVEAESKLIEVDSAGKIVWQWQAPNGANRRLYQATTSCQRKHADRASPIPARSSKSIGPARWCDPSPARIWISSSVGLRVSPPAGWRAADLGLHRTAIVEVDAAGKVIHELRTGPRTVASVDLLRAMNTAGLLMREAGRWPWPAARRWRRNGRGEGRLHPAARTAQPAMARRCRCRSWICARASRCLKGGEHGPAVEPGNPEKSRLYRFVAGLENPTMPPGKKLPDEQIATLCEPGSTKALRCRCQGSPPRTEEEAKAALAKMEERPITAEERQYWAFRPPVRHGCSQRRRSESDRCVSAGGDARQRAEAFAAADRRTLIRRAYLDLTGLPPTPAQVDAFVNDQSAERVLEGGRGAACLAALRRALGAALARSGSLRRFRRLRVRSRPPERLALSRLRDPRVQSTTSRTTVSCASRSPAMRSGPDSADARIATGYLRLGLENNLKNEQTRLDELDDLVTTTSNAFLGLTVGCARCHNHKFDPIPQKDYYRMQAVFFPTKANEYPLVARRRRCAVRSRAEADRRAAGALEGAS